ncbi:MAG: hypothetical protein R3320_03360 [Nitriliruptorales bacterium]|nr:hypothetical protein [Nitriliruptorales bacterium]
MGTDTLTTILKLDAVANEVGGIGLILGGAWLAEPMGLGAAWPLWLAGTLLLINGYENWAVARDPSATALKALAAVDLAFAVAVLGLAVANPTGAETWARWTLAIVGDVTAVAGITKLVGLRRVRGGVGEPASA